VSNPKGESVAPQFRRQPDGGGLVNEDALRLHPGIDFYARPFLHRLHKKTYATGFVSIKPTSPATPLNIALGKICQKLANRR
jgi:hypothetical protein